jgi:chromosome segregation ATPase
MTTHEPSWQARAEAAEQDLEAAEAEADTLREKLKAKTKACREAVREATFYKRRVTEIKREALRFVGRASMEHDTFCPAGLAECVCGLDETVGYEFEMFKRSMRP